MHRLARLLCLCLCLSPAGTAMAVDGDLDPTFDGDGFWSAASGGSYSFTRGARDPEGNLLIYGTRSSGGASYFHWRTIRSSGPGALCSYFPVNSSFLRLGGAAFDYLGRLVLGGSLRVGAADPVVVVLRFHYPDCTLDESLDASGIVLHAPPVAGTDLVNVGGVETARWFEPPALFRNRIVLPITLETAATQRQLHWLRLHENGAIDTGFGGGDGDVLVATDRIAHSIARATDGGYLVAANSDLVSSDFAAVYKLDRNGVPVTGFGAGGERQVNLPTSAEDRLDFLAVAPDGRIALGGLTDYESTGFAQQGFAARLTAAGQLDSGFGGGDGWMVYRRDGADVTRFRGAAFQGDGRLVLAGSTSDPLDAADDEAFAVRLLANGNLDLAFSGDGLLLLDLDDVPQGEDMGTGVALADDGRIWLAGSTQIEIAPGDTDYRPFAALLQNRYLFADGFERGSTASW